MSLEKHHGGWVLFVTFSVSLMLAIIPLPGWAVIWRPDWVALVLVYWCIAIPQRVGVATGWVIGILYDVLSDTLLGQHALILSFLAYLSVKLHRQVRVFPWWQQALFAGSMVAISELLEAWIRGAIGHPTVGWTFIYPAITSIVLWPWIFIILRDMRRTYQVF
ncbi:rod shape-determining protein MreD [Beggiatoa leptomitoformis]|uniref:Rod shape-determining protein MreD n=1 Tax=Beggiatoa leptomitoformis TaxID=288004 RepID=A0A2N9YD44_9GAMM|nr:rod shape-determining protein MreD [Beggiatoa leptomitoformis]ALG69168.1 rod shape-determining protein MreD [Beggiatoa leptomitoformis]AUI68408.1 rod shape-determining protein MreD [Beggiatoa leptomitoformis]